MNLKKLYKQNKAAVHSQNKIVPSIPENHASATGGPHSARLWQRKAAKIGRTCSSPNH